jgi:hypothetical protein
MRQTVSEKARRVGCAFLSPPPFCAAGIVIRMAAAAFSPTVQSITFFITGIVMTSVSFTPVPVWAVFPLMAALATVGGFANVIVDVLTQSVIQLTHDRPCDHAPAREVCRA